MTRYPYSFMTWCMIPVLLLILESAAHSKPWLRVGPVPVSIITWKGALGQAGNDKTRVYGLMAQGFMSIPGLGGKTTAPGMEKRIAQWLSSHAEARVVPVEAYPFFSKSVAYVYAWVVDGSENLNLILVREGYCRANTMLPTLQASDLSISPEQLSSFRQKLAEAEKSAAAEDLGIWRQQGTPGGLPPGTLGPPGRGILARLEQEAESAPLHKPPPVYDRKTPEGELVRIADGNDNAASYAALEELVRRSASGGLSTSAHAEIIRTGLDRQGDPKRPWRPQYGTLIERAYAAKRLSKEQRLLYAGHAVVPRVKAVPVPFKNLPPCRLFVEMEQRVGRSKKPSYVRVADGSRLLLSAGYRVTAVAIDGKPAVFDRNKGQSVVAWQENLSGGTAARGIGIRPAQPLKPGFHDLACSLEIRIYEGADAWNAARSGRAPEKVSLPISTRSLEFQEAFSLSSGSN